jgi:hypothetical protein
MIELASVGRRLLLAMVIAASVVVGLPRAAEAYPQYVGRGELDCSGCHYSPIGGGLVTAWGRESREASFGESTDDWPGHNDVTGFSDDLPVPEFDIGADARLLSLAVTEDGSGGFGVVVPMLAEVGAVAAYGRGLLYATVAARKGPPSGAGIEPFSREHWLSFAFGSGVSVRAGRLVLPFGLRLPDHTQYTREDFGFGPWGQSYAAEVDATSGSYSLSLAAFLGDLLGQPKDRQERGGAVRAAVTLADRVEVGVSALAATSPAKDRVAGGAFTRAQLWGDSYVMAEFDAQRFWARRSDVQLDNVALYLRAGWFALPELDVYVEAGRRTLSSGDWLTKSRYALGADWQTTHWLELGPELMVENVGGVSQYIAMGQLHLVY